MRGPGRRARVRINTAVSGDNTLVAAATDGSLYEIDFIQVIPTGGANTVGLKDGASSTIYSYPLDDNQAQTFDNASGDYPIVFTTNTAMILNLSAGTQVDGYVLYRIVGGADGM